MAFPKVKEELRGSSDNLVMLEGVSSPVRINVLVNHLIDAVNTALPNYPNPFDPPEEEDPAPLVATVAEPQATALAEPQGAGQIGTND